MNGGNREPATGRARAQTAQDFAVGIGIFLLAVGFVFAFVPSAITPQETGIEPSQATQADRAATLLVANLSADGTPNAVPEDRLDDSFGGYYDDTDNLRDETGLPFTSRINVTVTNINSSDDALSDPDWSGGAAYPEGQPAAVTVRVISTPEEDGCDPACELVVRVW